MTTQILELGLPVVIALNMMDLVEKNGDKIDVDKLSRELGCPIVPTSALKGRGMDELVKTAIELGKGVPAAPRIRFSDEIETALANHRRPRLEGLPCDRPLVRHQGARKQKDRTIAQADGRRQENGRRHP